MPKTRLHSGMPHDDSWMAGGSPNGIPKAGDDGSDLVIGGDCNRHLAICESTHGTSNKQQDQSVDAGCCLKDLKCPEDVHYVACKLI